ncbi:MAG: KR domain-containing protein [Crocinitomicaceae bacterium]|nr:KR domain-containing protein [Crocinitomicaceae bacterium]
MFSYSSISAIYGNPGQVSYVGANSFLDNFHIGDDHKVLPPQPLTGVYWVMLDL